MFACSVNLFELQEHEDEFNEICQLLKNHTFSSPWATFFKTTEIQHNLLNDVQEFNFPFLASKENLTSSKEGKNYLTSNNSTYSTADESDLKVLEEKFIPLKSCLSSIQGEEFVSSIDNIDLLKSLSISEITWFSSFIHDAFTNETSVAAFLNSISYLKDPLSVTMAAALVNQIIYPKISYFKSNNYRNLSLSLLTFFRLYPKAVIDEILIPCLKNSLETTLQEMLIKSIRTNLPDEYVGYCIKSTLNEAHPTESTFSMLLYLIEKKIQYDMSLHDLLAFKIQNWSTANSKSMKFIKLLISILSVYGPELTDQQSKIYSNVIKMNGTVMKKAAENLMKSLK